MNDPENIGYERRTKVLSRLANYSSADMGMSGHVYLFIDETGRAHSPNFSGAPEKLW
jgi:hypothetical protein